MRQITQAAVKQTLGRYYLTERYWAQSTRNYAGFSDEAYVLPNEEEILAIIAANPVTRPPTVSEAFDCDDFAFVFKGLACLYTRDHLKIEHSLCIGIAWGCFAWTEPAFEFHATNWVLIDQLGLLWCEPQNGTLYPLDNCNSVTLVLA